MARDRSGPGPQAAGRLPHAAGPGGMGPSPEPLADERDPYPGVTGSDPSGACPPPGRRMVTDRDAVAHTPAPGEDDDPGRGTPRLTGEADGIDPDDPLDPDGPLDPLGSDGTGLSSDGPDATPDGVSEDGPDGEELRISTEEVEVELRPQRRLRIWQLAPIVALAAIGSLMFAFPLAFEFGDSGAVVAMLGLLICSCAAGWGMIAARRVGHTWPGFPQRDSGRHADWRVIAAYAFVVTAIAVLAVWRVARLR